MQTLTKNIPHVRQMNIQMDAYKMLICSRIGWTETEYETYRFNAAMDFIDDMIVGLHPEDKKLITYSGLFWGWFKNKWYERDFKLYQEDSLTIDDYCGVHDYHLRTCEITIKGFYSMFTSIIDDGSESIKKELERALNA